MNPDAPWWEEAKRWPLATVAAELDITARRGRYGPCPACGAEADNGRGVLRFYGPGESLWKCHGGGCGASGAGLDLVGWAVNGRELNRADPAGYAAVRAWYAARGWCEPDPRDEGATRTPRKRPKPPPEPKPEAEPKRAPRADLEALWGASSTLDEPAPKEVAAFLDRRGFELERLAPLGLVRVLPNPSGYHWPSWWPGYRDTWAPYRLAVRAYEPDGTLAGIHARAVLPLEEMRVLGLTRTKRNGAEEMSPKTRWPLGMDAGGLLMASAGGLMVLEAHRYTTHKLRGVLVCEGLTDLLRASSKVAEERLPLGVLAAAAGGFSSLARVRWPEGFEVFIATDTDDTGDKYEEQIREALTGCDVRLKRLPMGAGMDFDEKYRDRPLGPDLDAAEDIPPLEGEEQDGPEAPPLERLTLAACAASWLRRLEKGPARHTFPWPGGCVVMPGSGGQEITAEALRPLDRKHMPGWDSLAGLVGPLFPDRLAVLVGPTGRGKSGLGLQTAEAVAAHQGADPESSHPPVLYASAEMGTDELVARLVALRANGGSDHKGAWGVAYSALLRGRAPLEAVRGALQSLVSDCPNLYLWVPTPRLRSAAGLQAAAQAVYRKHRRPPLVVVDYIQRLSPSDSENRRGDISELSAALRDLSRPEGLGPDWPGAAVLAISSTARSNYEYFHTCEALENAYKGPWRSDSNGGRRRGPPVPLVGMGKESGELEYDAPLVLCFTADAGDGSEPAPRKALIVVAKNRHGGHGTVELQFLPACGRFEEPGKKEAKPSTRVEPRGKRR